MKPKALKIKFVSWVMLLSGLLSIYIGMALAWSKSNAWFNLQYVGNSIKIIYVIGIALIGIGIMIDVMIELFRIKQTK